MSKSAVDGKECHICLVVSGLNEGGGIERHVRDLAVGLAPQHRVSVIAHESYRSLFPEPVEFHEINFLTWRFNPLFLLNFCITVRKLNPDILHAHGRKAARVILSTRVATQSKRVLTVHNTSNISRLAKLFDAVIAVSPIVAAPLDHPNKFIIFNGNG